MSELKEQVVMQGSWLLNAIHVIYLQGLRYLGFYKLTVHFSKNGLGRRSLNSGDGSVRTQDKSDNVTRREYCVIFKAYSDGLPCLLTVRAVTALLVVLLL